MADAADRGTAAGPDFKRLFEAAPGLYLVLRADGLHWRLLDGRRGEVVRLRVATYHIYLPHLPTTPTYHSCPHPPHAPPSPHTPPLVSEVVPRGRA